MERQTRNTKQRAVILQKLREVHSHPTADQVYSMAREAMPKISLGTVYRNLEMLVKQGEVLCIENTGPQKRFDGNPMPHHHVHCSQCGALGDLHAPVAAPDLSALQVEGFTLTGVNIVFEGVCDRCKM